MTDQTDQKTNQDDNKQLPTGVLSELVGEGKKFKTVEDLAIGKAEADAFIKKTTSENQELRSLVTDLVAKVDTLTKKTQFFDHLGSQSNNDDSGTDLNGTKDNGNQSVQAPMSADDVIKLVERRETTQRADANVAEVDRVLIKNFGAEAKAFVAQRAVELGISQEQLKALAQTSPTAFYSAVGISPNPSKTAGLTGYKGFQNDGGPKESGKRDNAYYNKLKGTMKTWEFITNKEIQMQLHRDMQEQGDAFFNS